MEERHPPLLWQLVMLLASVITVATLALSISIQLPADVESMLRWADTAVLRNLFFGFPAAASLGKKQKEISTDVGLDRFVILDSAGTDPAIGESFPDPQDSPVTSRG